MKPIRILPAVLFVLSLLLGIGLGTLLSPSRAEADNHPLFTLANEQRTILLILVDRLKVDASLTGIWTLIYAPSYRVPTWIPVYPAPPSGNTQYADQLAAAFRLTNDLRPTPAFLDLLSQQNLVWSGYIVADTNTIRSTLEFFGLSNPSTAAQLAAASNPAQDRNLALYNQASLFNSLCEATAAQPADFDLLELYVRVRKYTRTDFNLYLTFTEWKDFFHSGQHPSCQFPAIENGHP
ncbi:MAG: hypothetical protein ACOYYS_25030 [Chloroflexota bacterium]